jgi:hypothetical protein
VVRRDDVLQISSRVETMYFFMGRVHEMKKPGKKPELTLACQVLLKKSI